MSSIPEKPAIDGEGRSTIAVRFEDVAQDGRMLVEALATGVNDVLWRAALRGHPLETHAVELWLPADRLEEAGIAQLLDLLASAPFRTTLESVGGYDLADLGRRVA